MSNMADIVSGGNMISEEKLEKLYDGFIRGVDLTTKNLKKLGLSSNDLTTLVKENVLKREKIGHYIFLDAEKLFYYGKKLIKKNKPLDATICFEKCFLIDPNHHGAAFQLFFRCIKKGNYQEAFEFIDLLMDTDNEFYKRDMYYYLYLLSNLTEISDKYENYIRSLQFSDMAVLNDDKRYNKTYEQNKIRGAVFNKNFSYAFQLLNKLIANENRMTFQNKIEKLLLSKIILVNNEIIAQEQQLIKYQKYEELIDYLLKLKEKRGLRKLEEMLLYLSQKYLDIKKFGKIPITKTIQVDTLDKAVAANNFILARNLAKQFNEEHNIDNEQSGLYLLLCDICDLIKFLVEVPKKESKIVKKESIYGTEEYIKKCYEELKVKKGILLLNPMDSDKIKKILAEAEYYPDIYAFVIKWDGQEQVVLQYKSINFEYINVKEALEEARKAYASGDYSRHISIELELLEKLKKTNSGFYATIGSAYLKMGKKYREEAIKYLKVATYLAKLENVLNRDFTELIYSLNGKLSSESCVKYKQAKEIRDIVFDYEDVNDFYGIYNFKEINDYINETGVNVEAACEEFGLTKEQTLLVQLIYAREFYFQGNIVKGDLFLKAVEKSKEKTPLVKKIFEEIAQNKKFYQGRERDYTIDLKLTLVPKK